MDSRVDENTSWFGRSLDANGKFRPKQSLLHHRRVRLKPEAHPEQNQAFAGHDDSKISRFEPS
jgi:hypothetical protein